MSPESFHGGWLGLVYPRRASYGVCELGEVPLTGESASFSPFEPTLPVGILTRTARLGSDEEVRSSAVGHFATCDHAQAPSQRVSHSLPSPTEFHSMLPVLRSSVTHSPWDGMHLCLATRPFGLQSG